MALPGGAIAARLGDKRVVGAAIALMLAGAVLVAVAPGPDTLLAARLIAGVGGVIINVVMTKMVVDWFAGREISTAMAIFVNSWPVGIAFALLILPAVAALGGLTFAWWVLSGLIAASLVLFALLYHAPDGAAGPAPTLGITPLPYLPLILAGLIWALYNAALAMVFSFGLGILVEQGWSVAGAGQLTSTFMIVVAIALPVGGLIADRTGRRDTIILVSLLSFLAMPLVPHLPGWTVAPIFVAVGALFALAGGPIMTLPSAVLSPQGRSFGMGIFFTIYYGVMMIAPRIAGGLAETRGDITLSFTLGAVMSMAAILALALFRRTSAFRRANA